MSLQSFRSFLTESLSVKDISQAPKVGGKRGTNEGGEYLLNGKDRHYAKFYSNPQQAISEVAAAYVYEKLSVPTVKPFLVTHSDHRGKLGVASKWRDGLRPVKPNYGSWSESDKQQLAKHFVAAVVTKNWDAIGHHENIGRDGNTILNNDLGGVFRFRAQGGSKPFGDDIDEFRSLREPHRPAGEAFGHLHDRHIHQAIKSLSSLDKTEMTRHFKSLGLEDAEAHADAIHGRAQRLLRLVS